MKILSYIQSDKEPSRTIDWNAENFLQLVETHAKRIKAFSDPASAKAVLSPLEVEILAKTGIGYVLPQVINRYKIVRERVHFLSNLERPGADHIQWWSSELAELVTGIAKVKLSTVELEELKKAYPGFSRFRISYINNTSHIWNGNDINDSTKNQIIQSVGLQPNEYKFNYDNHEIRQKDAREIVIFLLNLSET